MFAITRKLTNSLWSLRFEETKYFPYFKSQYVNDHFVVRGSVSTLGQKF